MNTSDQLQNKLLLNKADAKALARKIKGAAYAAHGHVEQAGKWLIEFRDREGWKALGYDTWTACVQQEFAATHGGRAHVFRLIQNSQVLENIAEKGENPHVTRSESTKVSRRPATKPLIPVILTRHLAKLPAQLQRSIFERAVALGNGKPTEPTVKRAVEEAMKAATPVKQIRLDETGFPIPEELIAIWNRRVEVKDILWAISKARKDVRAAIEKNDPLFSPSDLSGALANLTSAYDAMEASVPYAVCPACQGAARDACAGCKGRGFVSQAHFDTHIPEEVKAVRVKSSTAL